MEIIAASGVIEGSSVAPALCSGKAAVYRRWVCVCVCVLWGVKEETDAGPDGSSSLLFRSNSRASLSGEDRKAGEGTVTFLVGGQQVQSPGEGTGSRIFARAAQAECVRWE